MWFHRISTDVLLDGQLLESLVLDRLHLHLLLLDHAHDTTAKSVLEVLRLDFLRAEERTIRCLFLLLLWWSLDDLHRRFLVRVSSLEV